MSGGSATSTKDSTNSLSNQGEFHSRVGRDEPLTRKGHQLGREPGPGEFHAEVVPPGTAPASKTYTPNPDLEDRPSLHGNNPTAEAQRHPGATSADVHRGLGHPGSGQSSAELRHDGQSGRRRASYGAEVKRDGAELGELEPRRDGETERGKVGPMGKGEEGIQAREGMMTAEEREPVGAEEVAAMR